MDSQQSSHNQPLHNSNVLPIEELDRELAQPAADEVPRAGVPSAVAGSGLPATPHVPYVPPAAPEGARVDEPLPQIFPDAGGGDEFIVGPPAPPKKLTPQEQNVGLQVMLEVRDFGQSRVLGLIAREPAKNWKMTEEQMEGLGRVWAPIMREQGHKVPWWIWVVLFESFLLVEMGIRAYRTGKVNAANARAVQSPKVQAAVAQGVMATEANETERIYFQIDERGRYIYPPKRKKYLREDLRTEQASVNDIEAILADPDNVIAVVQRAFPRLDLTLYTAA